MKLVAPDWPSLLEAAVGGSGVGGGGSGVDVAGSGAAVGGGSAGAGV